MTKYRVARMSVLLAAGAFALAGCGSLPSFGFGGNDRDAERAADEAGRIAMVLGDDVLEPDPGLASETIDLGEARVIEAWPQAGAQASKVVGHIQAAEALQIAWSRDAGAGSDRRSALTSPPVASSERIFVLDADQTVRAFNLDSGSPVWSTDIESGNRRDRIGIGGGLALEDDRVIVSSGFGRVVALNAHTGDEIWTRDMDAPMTGAPTIKDGRIFVTSNNNEVFALALSDGTVEWSDQAIAEPARVLGSPSPAAVEDIVVVPYSSGEVIAYLASNGRRLWNDALSRPGRFTPISAINDIASRPVLAGGLVIVANQSGVTAAIDGRSGARIWAQSVGSTQAPALAGEYLFISSRDALLVAMNAGTGQVYWTTQMPRWRDEDDQKGRLSYAGPILASGRIVTISSEGEVLAFDPQTGTQLDSLDLRDPVYLEPIAVDGRLYVLTDDARLVAIR